MWFPEDGLRRVVALSHFLEQDWKANVGYLHGFFLFLEHSYRTNEQLIKQAY